MSSLSVKLPITRDTADGFKMIRDFQTLVRQNFKMLILTAPGERVMEPEFGVGLRNFLFENFNNSVYIEIESEIRKQASIFLPVIEIFEINFDKGSDGISKQPNSSTTTDELPVNCFILLVTFNKSVPVINSKLC